MKRFVILLAVFAVAIPAIAQDKPTFGKGKDNPILKKFDKNGDGKLDEEEKQAVREKLQDIQSKPGGRHPAGKSKHSPKSKGHRKNP